MSTDEPVCKTVLLDDVPADRDEFHGPHQRVADAITDLIQNEPGGRVIGLEGGWGAGKSTVVSFAKNALQQKDDTLVITFDAWAHEGDPLRRTFLEAIVENLTRKGWGGDFQDLLSQITNRRKITETKVASKPTLLAKITAIALVLVAPCTVLLSSSIRGDWPTLIIWLIALFAFSPIVVILSYGTWVLVEKHLRKRRQDTQNGKPTEDWSFLVRSATSDTKTESTESSNPTSIEFEKYFRTIMQSALGVNADRRLVLILDNLDRVAAVDAITIWSTLQTFLKERDRGTETWFSQVWIVVPYDPLAIRKLWSKSATDQSVSESFLSKSLQLRFRVPPPVLSDWKAYLYRLIEKALPGHRDEATCHGIYRVYSTCCSGQPTPRELKLYVNQIGAVHRQWKHEFPMQHVAFYVLKCRDLNSFIEELRDGDVPSEEQIRMVADGEGLKRSLAGLAFNVPSDKGMELLLSEPIFQALEGRNAAALEALVAGNEDGALTVLESVLAGRVYESTAATIASAADTIFNAKICQDDGHAARRNIRDQLKSAILHIDEWLPFDDEVAGGLAASIQLLRESSFTKQVLGAVTVMLEKSALSKTEDIPENTQRMLVILKSVLEAGLGNVIEKPIRVPGWLPAWMTTCKLISGEADWDAVAAYIAPQQELSEILTFVSGAAKQGNFNEGTLDLIGVTNRCCKCDPTDWDQVAHSIHQRLLDGISQSLAEEETTSLLEGLWLLRSIGAPNASELLDSLVHSGHVAHYYQASTNAPLWTACGLCALSILRTNPALGAPKIVGQAAAGHKTFMADLATADKDHARVLCILVEKYGQFDIFFDVIDARGKCDPLISACLHRLSSGSIRQRVFNLVTVKSRWAEVKSALGANEFAKLIQDLISEDGLCQAICQAAGGFRADDIVLYQEVAQQAGDLHRGFFEWCREGIEGSTKEEWLNDFDGDYDGVRLAQTLSDMGVKPHLSTRFSDALLDRARMIATGELTDIGALQELLPKVLPCLDGSVAKAFSGSLFEVAVERGGGASSEFFSLFGECLANKSVFLAQRRIVERFASPIVRERNVAGLAWLAKFLGSNKAVLSEAAPDDNVNEFRTRIRDCVEKPEDGEAQVLIDQLAVMAGVHTEAVDECNADAITEDSNSGERK
jgi:hypothetical protein